MQSLNLQLKWYNIVNILLWDTNFSLDSSGSKSSELNTPSAFVSQLENDSGGLGKGMYCSTYL